MNHTTNYFNAFIEIAADCSVKSAEIPPQKGEEKTIDFLQFELIYDNPYKYTSDEIIFNVFALRNKIPDHLHSDEKKNSFPKARLVYVHHRWENDTAGVYISTAKVKLPFILQNQTNTSILSTILH